MACFIKLFGKKEKTVGEVFGENNAAVIPSGKPNNPNDKKAREIVRGATTRKGQILVDFRSLQNKLQTVDSQFALLGDQLSDITFKYQQMKSNVSDKTLEIIDQLLYNYIKYLENYINRKNIGAATETIVNIDNLVNDIVSDNAMFSKESYFVTIIKRNKLKQEMENLLSDIKAQKDLKNNFSKQYNNSTSNFEKKDLYQRVNSTADEIKRLESLRDRLHIKYENLNDAFIAFKEAAISNEIVNMSQYEDLMNEALNLANDNVSNTKLDEEFRTKLKKAINYVPKSNITVTTDIVNDSDDIVLPDTLEVDD